MSFQQRVFSAVGGGVSYGVSETARRWTAVREFFNGLRVAWVSLASVLLGLVMFAFAPQAQDLFLEVRGDVRGIPFAGKLFWIGFYVATILVWMLPVYVSARWILYRFRFDERLSHGRAQVADWVCRTVPRALAVACLGAVFVGQLMALVNAPTLLDEVSKEKSVQLERQFKSSVAKCEGRTSDTDVIGTATIVYCNSKYLHLAARGILMELAASEKLGAENIVLVMFGVALFVLLFYLATYWIYRAQRWPRWLVTALWIYGVWVGAIFLISLLGGLIPYDVAEFLLFVLAFGTELTFVVIALTAPLVIWLLLPAGFRRIPYVWPKRILLFLWWTVTVLVTLVIVVLFGAAALGFTLNEIDEPLGVGHLALLPPITAILAGLAWWLLQPDEEGRPTRLGGFFLWGPAHALADADHVHATVRVWNPAFYVILVLSLLGLAVQIITHPVDFTVHVYRALMLPVFLGLLVPAVTYLSQASFRLQAPIAIGALLLLAVVNGLRNDIHDVRVIDRTSVRPTLEETVERWASVNECTRDINGTFASCPSPIIISAAGGASRAAFLVAAAVGKLMDEGNTKGSDTNSRPFEKQLFAISGVSGGSLGAAVTYAALADSQLPDRATNGLGNPPCKEGVDDTEYFAPTRNVRASWRNCLERILAGDFLSPVFVNMISNDLFGAPFRGDRAEILEHAWERRYADLVGQRYGDSENVTTMESGLFALRKKVLDTDARNWLPMLALNGTSVSTGRRVVASDVDTLYTEYSQNLEQPRRRLFRDAYDFHELFLSRPSETGRRRQSLEFTDVSVDPFDRRFFAQFNYEPQFWDLLSGKLAGSISGHDEFNVAKAAFDASGRNLLILSSEYFSDNKLRIYDAETGREIRSVELGSGVNLSASMFNPDRTKVLAATNTGVRLIDVATGRVDWEETVDIFYADYVAAFSPDGKWIGMAFRKGNVELWKADTGTKIKSMEGTFFADDVAFGPDGTLLALLSAGPNEVTLWDTKTGGKRTLTATPDEYSYEYIWDLVFSPDGSYLLGVASNVSLVWELADGKVYRSFKGWGGASFAPDNKHLLVLNNGAAELRNMDTHTLVRRYKSNEGRILGTMFLNAGNQILTWDDNGTANLWNTKSGEQLHVMRGYRNPKASCQGCDVRLSTAVTMSARFPIISPHGNIRNSSGEIVGRVVDGGYYENFGAITAFEIADVLRERYALRPAVILINNEPTVSGMNCITPDSRIAYPDAPRTITFSAFRSPLNAVMGTRGARGTHAAVELCSRITSDNFAFISVEPDPTNKKKALSMSWWLSKHVQKYLDRQVDTHETDENEEAFAKISRWRQR